MIEKILELEKQIKTISIEDGGEGAVVYFVEKEKNTNELLSTLTLCKMKTLEYTIFRRIREMTKKLIGL